MDELIRLSKKAANEWRNTDAYYQAAVLIDSLCDRLERAENGNQQTNADRIRAMSDEELADWLARNQIANVAEALAIAKIPYEQEDGLKDEVAKECMEWLKQPVE